MAISKSGDTIVVGAPNACSNTNCGGAVYVFTAVNKTIDNTNVKPAGILSTAPTIFKTGPPTIQPFQLPTFTPSTFSPTSLPTEDQQVSFDFEILETGLPKGLSDHTSVPLNDIVYIAGGCDSQNGNEWDNDLRIHLCRNISDSFFAFHVLDNTVTELPDMPVARYRHASVAVNNQVWLLGGRDLDDAIVSSVDVSKWVGLPSCLLYNHPAPDSFAAMPLLE